MLLPRNLRYFTEKILNEPGGEEKTEGIKNIQEHEGEGGCRWRRYEVSVSRQVDLKARQGRSTALAERGARWTRLNGGVMHAGGVRRGRHYW